jgi:hypothetical protein
VLGRLATGAAPIMTIRWEEQGKGIGAATAATSSLLCGARLCGSPKRVFMIALARK